MCKLINVGMSIWEVSGGGGGVGGELVVSPTIRTSLHDFILRLNFKNDDNYYLVGQL